MNMNRNRYLPFLVTAFLLLSILANAQSLSYLPAGSLQMYGGATAPAGWALCDGSAVSRTGTYARVFAAIGTRYGAGDGSTTFNLPNFQGVFPKGHGSQSIGGVTYANASGTPQADKVQGHYHGNDGRSYVTNADTGVYPNITTGGGGFYLGNVTVSAPATDGTNGTPRTGTVTEPANVGVNFIIKL